MQMMSWAIARFGSRFTLLFEPYQKRIMHSALGRFLDQPLDLMIGLTEPDGTQRALPFTNRCELLYNCEQFERMNSITFRGYCRATHLRFEFNIHSVFYPQNEPLCTMPAFYMEMRLYPAGVIRREAPGVEMPHEARLFFRIHRPNTTIVASQDNGGRIDMTYDVPLEPEPMPERGIKRSVTVHERIQSRNIGAVVDDDGQGLSIVLPVTQPGEGVKWRFVWGAFCDEPIADFGDNVSNAAAGRFKYTDRFSSIDDVMDEAITERDDRLAHSRRFEKLLDQIPLQLTEKHLIHQGFQTFNANTFWLIGPGHGQEEVKSESDPKRDTRGRATDWFSVTTGRRWYHGAIDVDYNMAMFYLGLWPSLLAMQFKQWAQYEVHHERSGGGYLSHDVGRGLQLTGPAYDHEMPVEENSDFLLLIQAYARWTGDLNPVHQQADLIERLTRYLIWTDRDDSGFPSEGTPNTLADAAPAAQYARKQTYLAVKRMAGLRAAADLLGRLGRHEIAENCDRLVDEARTHIHDQAWLGDHYAVCVDKSAVGLRDATTGEPLPYDELPGWDAYSIYTGNGLLLQTMIGQPPTQDFDALITDMVNSTRETLGPYGCGHTSMELHNVHISQNIWRDLLMRYLGYAGIARTQRYWDMQVMSNTGDNSHAYTDTYINNDHTFFPRGITALGYLYAYPRLTIDKLAPGGARISVDPDRNYRQRWPLLPLADWKAGKVPVCVVDPRGNVSIEGGTDPIIIRGQDNDQETTLIG